MSWESSTRVVPPDWAKRKARVLARDGRVCHVCGGGGADEVDHLVPVARGGGHDYSNLAAIHARPCHLEKTQAEAAEGRALKARRRPTSQTHPGLV